MSASITLQAMCRVCAARRLHKARQVGKAAAIVGYGTAATTGKALWKTALAAETAVVTTAALAKRHALQQLRMKAVQGLHQSDSGRALHKTHRVAQSYGRLVKTARHARSVKLELKPQMAGLKLQRKQAKLAYKGKIGTVAGTKRTAKVLRRELKKDIKSYRRIIRRTDNKFTKLRNTKALSAAKSDRKLVSIVRKESKTQLIYAKKLHKQNKMLLHKSKHATRDAIVAGGGAAIGRKLVNAAGDDNDVAMAAEKITSAARTLRRRPTPTSKLQKRQSNARKLSKQSTAKQGKLTHKQSRLQGKKQSVAHKGRIRNAGRNRQRPVASARRARRGTKVTQRASISPHAGQAGGLKKAAVWAVLPILLLVLTGFGGLMMMSGFGDASVIALGTFLADEDDLTKSIEYMLGKYTAMNDKIIGIPSNWKQNLGNLGVNTSAYDTAPAADGYHWGYSAKLPYTGYSDYDAFRLLAFLTAYNYDFATHEAGDWTLNNANKTILDNLFAAQYAFEHVYEKVTWWEWEDIVPLPDATVYPVYEFAWPDDVHLGYFRVTNTAGLPDSILQPIETVPGTVSRNTVFWMSTVGWAVDQNLQETGWQVVALIDNPAYATSGGAPWVAYVREERRWVERTRVDLYYNVKQNAKMDEAILSMFAALPDYDERVEYYKILTGRETFDDDENTAFNLYGGHQAVRSPLTEALRDLRKAGRILRTNGGDFRGWNNATFGTHEGIDIAAAAGAPVYAMVNGVVKNRTDNQFQLDAADVQLYDSTWNLHIVYEDVTPTVSNGQTVVKGQQVGVVNTGRVCGETGRDHLHVAISRSKFGVAAQNIDPLLVIDFE